MKDVGMFNKSCHRKRFCSCSNTCIKKWTWRTFEKFNTSYCTIDDDVSKCKCLVTFEYLYMYKNQ
jgi:hypothetical protein